jgi:predicted ester cyclase
MVSKQDAVVADRFMEGVLNRGDLALVDEIFDPAFIDHSAPEGLPPGPEGVKLGVAGFRRAFPDFRCEVEDKIVADGKVVSRVSCEGTMRGDLFGTPSTGASARWEVIHITRLVDGRIVEHWSHGDDIGMLRQLGLLPGAATSGA